jgi:NADPH-dependent glutamate synthase beta subunit-like oxidoreductase
MTAPASLIALAAELVDTNPAASQLIVNLGNAETAVEVVEALNVYDETVLDSLESDEDEDEDEDETDEVEVEVDESELVAA